MSPGNNLKVHHSGGELKTQPAAYTLRPLRADYGWWGGGEQAATVLQKANWQNGPPC